jgi:dihydroflavonol-4-reductase
MLILRSSQAYILHTASEAIKTTLWQRLDIAEVFMNIQYLVTGATGHLGRTVTDQLIGEGKSVRVFALPNEKDIPEKATVYYGDVRDKESMRAFFADLAGQEIIVIHCAGIVSIASRFIQAVYDVNVTGTKNVVDLCKEHSVAKLVYISSVHAIPEQPKGTVIVETEDFSADKVVGNYAKTKAEATAFVLDAARQGLNACIVHPSGIIGPNDYSGGHTTAFVVDYCKGRLISCVRGGYDFVDVRDVANGIISVCERGRRGESYILSNRFYKVGEILDLLHEITGKRRIKTYVPLRIAQAAAPLTELYCKVLKRPPIFTAYSIYTLNSNALFSHEKATRQLAYTTRDMRETLTDMIMWLEEHDII